MEQVNARIIARMANDVPLVPELAGHLIAMVAKCVHYYVAGAGIAGGSPLAVWPPQSVCIRLHCCMMM